MTSKDRKKKTVNFTKSRKNKTILKNKLKKEIEKYDGTDEFAARLDKIAKGLSALYVKELKSDKLDLGSSNVSNNTEQHSTPGTSNNSEVDRFKAFFDANKSEDDIEPQKVDKKGVMSKEKIKSLTKLENFETYATGIDEKKIETTVDDKMSEIRELLKTNSVVLIQGDTGCGKTTKIPRLLMNEYKRIVCTQPRRLAAVNVARKVSKDLGCKLGVEVGYAVRFEDVSCTKTKLKFVTDGILLQELSSCGRYSDDINKSCKIAGYDLIIIDEAHERTINIDFLLGYFKKALADKKVKTKVLIMSATINAEIFKSFFSCPSVVISHKIHPLEIFNLKSPINDYVEAAIQTVYRIIEKDDRGDILVFLTGQDEIENAQRTISAALKDKKISVLKLFSSMPPEEQDLVFSGTTRKIILSTNVAETSVTIENIKYVIDSGKFKCKSHNIESSIDFLENLDISQAQARQRAGRAGRTQPGKVYRLYTIDHYEKMIENPIPEITRSKLSSVILSLKSLGIHDVVNFDYIDHPGVTRIEAAERLLYYYKAIDYNSKITPLGKQLSRFPVSPELGITFITAYSLGCLNAVVIMSAFLEFQSPFIEFSSDSPLYQKLKAIKSSFAHPKGDLYSYYTIFYQWASSNFSEKFLKRNFLNIRTMNQIRNVVLQLLRFFPETMDTSNKIEESFCAGHFLNVAKIDDKCYKTIVGNIPCFLHPRDGLYKEHPKYVLFFELFCSYKEFMSHCLEIDINTLTSAVSAPIEKAFKIYKADIKQQFDSKN